MEAAAETCITTAGSIADESKEHTTNSATKKKGVKFVKGHYWLAMSLKHQRKYKQALVIVEEAVHLSPKNTDLKLLHAEIKRKIESHRCKNPNCSSNNSEIDTEIRLMACSRCNDISYCGRKCQKEDWPRHKIRCKANFSHRDNCSNCNTRVSVSQRIRCSACGKEQYCSQKCLEKHKVKHQADCLVFQRFRKPDTVVDNEANLFNQWYDTPETFGSITINELATHAMTKQQFTNKKPNFVVVFEVRLNKNFLTFVPKEMPKVVYLSELPLGFANQIRERSTQYSKNLKPHQFGHTMVVTLDRICHISHLTPPENRIRHQVLEARDYRRKTLQVTQRGFFYGPFILTEKLAKLWIPLIKDTFQKQLCDGFLDANVKPFLIGFMMAAYRLQSRSINIAQMKSGRFSKFLVVRVEVGNEVGEVKRAVSHSMMLRKDAMQVSDLKSYIEHPMDAPTEPGIINFPIIFMTSFSFITPDDNYYNSTRYRKSKEPNEYVNLMVLKLAADPDKLSKKSEIEIDKDIENQWKKLCNLKIKFPACKKLNINDFKL